MYFLTFSIFSLVHHFAIVILFRVLLRYLVCLIFQSDLPSKRNLELSTVVPSHREDPIGLDMNAFLPVSLQRVD